MIIDIHTHTFPDRIAAPALRKLQDNCHTALFSDGTEAGLHAAELAAGVDLAVVQPVATNPAKVSHINDAVLRVNSAFPASGILSFGAMHPACPVWEEELERLRAHGVRGIKLHPPYAGMDIDDPRYLAILRKCRDLGLMVLIHSGRDVGVEGSEASLPEKVRRALDRVGSLTLIAAHMGGWGCWQDVLRFLPDTGVRLDTSFSLGWMFPAPDEYPWRREDLKLLEEEAFIQIIQTFGAKRILFGSDSPWADPGEELKKLRRLPLAPEDLEDILGRNAQALLGLS